MLFKIVIFVTSTKATAGRWRMGKLVSCEDFPNEAHGHDSFRKFLLKHPNIPIQLIVDAVEEDFRLESMPHAFGSGRKEMVERKLNQLYRNTNYRTWQFVGREADKRRDDRFLFMAMSNPDLLAPWISAIEDLQAPLGGVYLRASVSQLLVKALKLKDPDLLLMTRQTAGLRQTYFSNQHLRVSRLTPLSGLDARQIEKLYVTETEKTRLYLISLRMMSRETRLHVVFPATEPVHEELISQLEAGQGVSCRIIGPTELAKSIGINQEWLQRFPDLLHMHMLARHACQGNLAPAGLTRHYQVHNLRLGINLASIATVAAVTTIAISNLLTAADLKQQKQDALTQTVQEDRMYEEVSRNFPKTPLPGKDLELAVHLAEKIQSIYRTPQQMMQVIGEALNAQREVQINRLHWKLTEDANAGDAEGKQAAGPGQNTEAPPPPSPTGLYEIGFMEGEISNFSGDYRAALESVNLLVDTLKKNSAVEQISILQQPVNTSSLASLQGSTLDQQAQQLPAAIFKLKIILKAAPATPPGGQP